MRRTQVARWLLGSLFLSLSAAANGGSEPEPSCAERTADQVQARYDSIHDLSANFEQTIQSVFAGSGADAKSSGRVTFSKPGRMRWSYETPRASEVISDGSTLWLYDPVAAEVQKLPVTQGYLAGAGLQFLIGEGELRKQFAVSAEQCGAEGQDVVELELLPREPASYERMRLRVRPGSGEVLETAIVDLFGNHTRIAFSALVVNQNPPESLFRFEAPEGVEVIDLRLPQ
jgi:outer membrane lipoprotein carrier protein